LLVMPAGPSLAPIVAVPTIGVDAVVDGVMNTASLDRVLVLLTAARGGFDATVGAGTRDDDRVGVSVPLLPLASCVPVAIGSGPEFGMAIGPLVVAPPTPAANCPAVITFAVFVGVATVDGVTMTGAAAVTFAVVVVVFAVVAAEVIGAAVTLDVMPAFVVIAPVVATGVFAVATNNPPPSPAPLVMIGFGPELIDEFTVISGFGTDNAGSTTCPVSAEMLPLGLAAVVSM